MRQKLVTVSAHRISLLFVVLLFLSLVPFSSSSPSSADAAPPPTAISPTGGTGSPASLGTIITSGTSTVPTPLCAASCVITGGTKVGNNLFHSFGDFNIGALDSAQFQTGLVNPHPDASVSNILARVTGGSSNLFGNLDSATYYPSANLFLMNPAGFLFGQNATVNVGGMMTFTTADYMRLREPDGSNPGIFHADTAKTSILTSAPVAAFGFIGSTQAITFEGGQLTVASGTGITLVGGDINLVPDLSDAPSGITAPGRQIRLTSVAGAGEVAADTAIPAPGMALGNITLGQGTLLSTAGDHPSFEGGSGGAVSIRGGQLVATGATITTSPAEGSFGTGGEVTISVTGSAAFTDSMIQTSPADFSFGGTGGAVSIAANDSLTMTNTNINTSTFFAGGDSGPVTLTTNGFLSLTDSSIITASVVSGNAAAVTATGSDVSMSRSLIDSSVEGDQSIGLETVQSGVVTVTANNTVTLSGSSIDGPIISTAARGTMLDASPVIITGKNVNLSNGMIDTGMNGGNPPIISPGNGGAIEIHGNTNLNQFSLHSINSGLPESTGAGGNIRLVDADNIQLTASRLDASAGSGGGGGNIEFLTKALTISEHTDVGTSSFGQGTGGTVTVRGAENVTVESGSRVLTDVVVSLAGVPQGTAGNILIETQNLTLQGGGQIRAGAEPLSTGNAANITVQGTSSPAQSVLIDGPGSGIFTTTEGTGAGGNIFVNANSVAMTNGSSVSASSTGPGNTGNIQINAGNQFAMTNSSVTTQANQASGGIIKITTAPSGTVQLTSSLISASVLDGTGGGGSVNIDPQSVILLNSQILAQAVQGPGGNISITTNLLLPDANSVISASSQFGLNGSVTIQSPNAPGAGEIQPLGKSPLIATSLLNQRCASLAGGEFSSFTVAGRDSLPTEPGSWLTSPLYAAGVGTGLEARGEGRASVGELAGETPLLSLRQIAPAGFLTQAFAVDWSASCQS